MEHVPDNFDQLRKLLALKRYEQPPPGFFSKFTRDVMRRISEPRTRAELVEDRTWVRRLWDYLEARPWVAGAVGAVACAMLVAWIIHAQRVEWPSAPHPVLTQQGPELPVEPTLGAETERATAPLFAASTNPVPPGLFDPFGLRIERVNLSISNR